MSTHVHNTSFFFLKIKKLVEIDFFSILITLPNEHFFLVGSQPRLARKLLRLGTKESMSKSK